MNEQFEYVQKMSDLRIAMWRASEKATKASKEYNELVDQLKLSEQESWAIEMHGEGVANLRADMKTDSYRPLKSAYARYVFWKGEVERMSALLVGENAYDAIYNRYKPQQGGI